MLITLITFFAMPGSFVIFGILHLIGFAIVVTYPFLKYRYYNAVVGLIIIFIGILLAPMRSDNSWLIWLGIVPDYFVTLDFTPVFPWLGVVFFGIFVGNTLYQKNKRQFSIPDLSKNIIVKQFCYFGRHSLKIYLLHIPIILAVLYLIGSV